MRTKNKKALGSKGLKKRISQLGHDRVEGGDHATTNHEMPFHSIAIRVVSSYLQISAMLLRFDLNLPDSVRTLVVIEASVSSLSEQLLMFDCATTLRTPINMFFMKQIMSSYAIPVGGMVAIRLVWACRGTRRRRKHEIDKN